MGSLVGGWDNSLPGIAPQDMQDIREDADEVAANKGYFAAYERSKSIRKSDSGDGGAAEIASTPHLSHRLSLSRRSLDAVMAGDSAGSGAGEGSVNKSFLVRKSLDTKDQKPIAWWKMVDSGMLNEVPTDELHPTAADNLKAGYVPQYSVTGQMMNYRIAEQVPAPVAPAGTTDVTAQG